ncbi:MAG: hypothetical protein J6W61_03665 [Bacteroidales bacterium]|nr:hypothetical protein [Bacteroidales bacterium]
MWEVIDLLTLLKCIGLIWLIGGLIFYFYMYSKHGNDGLDNACRRMSIPTFVGELLNMFNTVLIGFPYFVYKFVKRMLKEDE